MISRDSAVLKKGRRHRGQICRYRLVALSTVPSPSYPGHRILCTFPNHRNRGSFLRSYRRIFVIPNTTPHALDSGRRGSTGGMDGPDPGLFPVASLHYERRASWKRASQERGREEAP
jgi:hypothetical protein